MCRSFDIPMVISDVEIDDETMVIIDTRRELIITNPTNEDIELYNKNHFNDSYNNAINHGGYLFLANVSSNLDIDKVSSFQKKYGNNKLVAYKIWNSIVYPVLYEHIIKLSNDNDYINELQFLTKSMKDIENLESISTFFFY